MTSPVPSPSAGSKKPKMNGIRPAGVIVDETRSVLTTQMWFAVMERPDGSMWIRSIGYGTQEESERETMREDWEADPIAHICMSQLTRDALQNNHIYF